MLVLFLKYDKAKNDLEPKVLLLKCGESQISLTIFFTSRQCYSFTYDWPVLLFVVMVSFPHLSAAWQEKMVLDYHLYLSSMSIYFVQLIVCYIIDISVIGKT